MNGRKAVTVEMVLKVRRAWQAVLGHVALRAKQAKAFQSLNTEIGNSVRGKRETVKT